MRESVNTIHRRRASMYVAVIGCSMVIAVIGISALMGARMEGRSAGGTTDLTEARLYAQSAIEMGMWTVYNIPSWRSSRINGAWATNQPLGEGSFSLDVIDPIDGVLSDSKSEPIELTGTGVLRGARYILSATATAQPVGLKALNTCLHSSGAVTIESSKSISLSGAPLSTNGAVNGPGIITGNVEAASIGVPPVIVGTSSVPAAAKEMPDAEVFDLYIGLATSIPASGTMEKFVLTPTLNPWGAPNLDGVYFVDTTNSDLTLRKARIEGTLIVKCGPTKKVRVEDTVFFKSAKPNYPTLLVVDGSAEFKWKSATDVLSESAASTNFNPPGAPYGGVSDPDKADTYPNEIQGLVHVNGAVTLDDTARIRGVLIAEGSVTVKGTNEIIHDPVLYSNPPMGYVTYLMQIAAGSYRRVVLP